MEKTSVLLADHQCVVREAIGLLIQQREDIEVVGESDNALQTIELMGTLQPDLRRARRRRS